VAGVNTMHNFLKESQHHLAGVYSRSLGSGRVSTVTPLFTFPDQQDCGTNCYALGPTDFATIYNVLPLWQSGIDGTGQRIAIVGRSNINKQDVSDFRTMFGLPPNEPEIILNGRWHVRLGSSLRGVTRFTRVLLDSPAR
jgi:subtilase family serine protease